MTHCLLALIILVPIGDLCIFDIQYSVERTFIFSGVDTEKCYLISLTVELIKFFFNYYLAAPRPTLGHYRGDSLIDPM